MVVKGALPLLLILNLDQAEAQVKPLVELSSTRDLILINNAESYVPLDTNSEWKSVRKLESDGRVNWRATTQFNYGYTDAKVWFKTIVRNSDDIRLRWFLEVSYPLLRNLEVHIVSDKRPTADYVTGRFSPIEQRPIAYRSFLFPVELDAGEIATIYLGIKTGGSLRADYRLLSEQAIIKETNLQSIGFGIYFGVMAGLVFYNLFLFFALRDRNYLLYVLYAASFGALQAALTGHASQYLWSADTFWNRISVPFLVGFSFFFLATFTRSSLDTKAIAPRADKLLSVLALFSVSLMGIAFGDYGILPNKLASLMVSYAPLLVIPSIAACVNAGSKPARYYSIAFAFFFAGAGAVALKDLGIVPTNYVTLYGMPLGSAIEAIFFSITLAYRVRILQDEKLATEVMIASTQSALEQSRLQLQSERELSEFASQIAHDIRSPLSALDVVLSHSDGLSESGRILSRTAISRIKDIANNLLGQYRLGVSTAGHTLDQKSIVREVHLLPSLLESLISEKRVQFRNLLKVELSYSLEQNSYGIFARIDASLLKRVLSNLINNGVEALANEEGFVQIELSANAETVFIKVIDDGCGIPNDRIDLVGNAGISFGKKGVDAGSGLGLYHAHGAIEQMNGILTITSKEGVGTEIQICLPRSLSPAWFVDALEIEKCSYVVVVDDDNSIHHVWDARLEAVRFGVFDIKVVHLSTPAKLSEWVCAAGSEDLKKARFLVDHGFIGSGTNGLKMIDQLNIRENSILVTSQYDVPNVMEEAQGLGVRLIPKAMAALVPIKVIEPKILADAILIDDDPLVHLIWATWATDMNKIVFHYADFDEFLNAAQAFHLDSRVYVDVQLAEQSGIGASAAIHKMGYTRIFLCTGYDADGFSHLKYLEGVVGKDPPAT